MKRKLVISLSALLAVSVLFTGCQVPKISLDKSEESVSETESYGAGEIDDRINELEIKQASENLTVEEYHELSNLYIQKDQRAKGRDTLEQCYRLYEDEDSLVELADITVNITEEVADTEESLELIFNDLENLASYDDVISDMNKEGVFSVLMPKLTVGSRNYYKEGEDGTLYYLSVGYENAAPYIRTNMYGTGGILTAVNVVGGGAQYFVGGYQMEDETLMYNGAFDLWTIDLGTGFTLHENGTFVNNMLDGEYTADDGENIYRGIFTAGQCSVEQPGEASIAKLIDGTGFSSATVYAKTEDGKKCLWSGINEGSMNFTSAVFNLPTLKAVETYTPLATNEIKSSSKSKSEIKEEDLQIRIYDGEVQYYNGEKWVTYSTTTELEQKDPFKDTVKSEWDLASGSDSDGASTLSIMTVGLAANRNTASLSESEAASDKKTESTNSASKTSSTDTKKTQTNNTGTKKTETKKTTTTSSGGSSNPYYNPEWANSASESSDDSTPAAAPAASTPAASTPAASAPAESTPASTPAPTPAPEPEPAEPATGQDADDMSFGPSVIE